MNPLDPALLYARLAWPLDEQGPLDLVLDTDTYNEIDDQFALAYAELSPDRLALHAIHAAPFHNSRSDGPGDGMAKSYDEIIRVLEVLGRPSDGRVLRGSTSWLPEPATPVASEARDDLIERARAQPDDRPLYVAAIGAITNVASAILAAPDIREKIVVVWLAGQPLFWPTAAEFNLKQDAHASRVMFDSGVPLVLIPCRLVAECIKTTAAELDAHLAGTSAVGAYLAGIFRGYEHGQAMTSPGRSKEIWDLAAIAWLMDRRWVSSQVESSPILTGDLTWSRDGRRHPIRIAQHIRRDPLFADLFAKCAAGA